MGLIRKQAGFDLKAKIEEWIKSCPVMNMYAEQGWVKITPDYTIKITHSYALRPILLTEGEMPDYLIFDFSDCGMILIDLPWSYEEILKNFNKCDKYITGIKHCIVTSLSGKAYALARYKNEWIRTHYINCLQQ